jgi:hypothetical protein
MLGELSRSGVLQQAMDQIGGLFKSNRRGSGAGQAPSAVPGAPGTSFGGYTPSLPGSPFFGLPWLGDMSAAWESPGLFETPHSRPTSRNTRVGGGF